MRILIFVMKLLVVFSEEVTLYTYLASVQQLLYGYEQKKEAQIG